MPSRLGDAPAVAAIDPGARGTPSGSGPLGTLIQHLSVSVGGGSALGAVVALRIVALLAVVWAARLVAELGARHPDRALTLTALNPLVLLYLVSAARLDALLIAFVLAAFVAARQRRWLSAVVLVCLGGSVAAPAFVVLPVLVAVHVAGRRRSPWWRLVGRDLLAAAAVTGGLGLARVRRVRLDRRGRQAVLDPHPVLRRRGHEPRAHPDRPRAPPTTTSRSAGGSPR